jgi:hypothetical protein
LLEKQEDAMNDFMKKLQTKMDEDQNLNFAHKNSLQVSLADAPMEGLQGSGILKQSQFSEEENKHMS